MSLFKFYDTNFSQAKYPAFNSAFSKASRNWTQDPSGVKNAGEFNNIDSGISVNENQSNTKIVDAIRLCEKAYFNVSIFRQTIDMQTQFCNSPIRFTSKNKKAAQFFSKWYQKINGWNLSAMFFREWFRSGNVFLYKMKGELNVGDIKKMSRTDLATAKSPKIPLKYVIVKATDIRYDDASSLLGIQYFKSLNRETVKRLKARKTDTEKEIYNSLTKEQKEQVNNETEIRVELTPDNFVSVFCNKQDYEPMSVPMYYPVLNDINLKLQFKAAEQVIARTVDYAILLITAGEKERSADENFQTLNLLNELFSAESIGRILIADYTVNGNWLIPDLNKIFGAEKYKVVDNDIANGLMNIFYGSEKFANSVVKIQVFLELLKHAREAYINEFLKPEMALIAKELNISEIPEVTFEDINLKDETEYLKIYTRLYELGLLTAEETFDSFKTHRLPETHDSEENQKKFKELRDNGLYSPQKTDNNFANGRPTGTSAPQSTKKVSPIGASKGFSLNQIVENIKTYNDLLLSVENEYKELKGLKRLSKANKDICEKIAEDIVIQEPKNEWNNVIHQYIVNPGQKTDSDNLMQVAQISEEHNISFILAALLRQSVI